MDEQEKDELRKDQLTLKFAEGDTILVVAVKIPNEFPRVLPLTIDDVSLFLDEEFTEFWKSMAEKVKNELVRGIV